MTDTQPDPTPQPGVRQGPATPPPPPGYAQQQPLHPNEERQWAMLGHLGGIILGFISPLVVWLVFRERSGFVNDQGREGLNFQITVALAWVAAGVLSLIGIGVLLAPVIIIGNLVFCLLAGIAANRGEQYRYPFTLRLVS